MYYSTFPADHNQLSYSPLSKQLLWGHWMCTASAARVSVCCHVGTMRQESHCAGYYKPTSLLLLLTSHLFAEIKVRSARSWVGRSCCIRKCVVAYITHKVVIFYIDPSEIQISQQNCTNTNVQMKVALNRRHPIHSCTKSVLRVMFSKLGNLDMRLRTRKW